MSGRKGIRKAIDDAQPAPPPSPPSAPDGTTPTGGVPPYLQLRFKMAADGLWRVGDDPDKRLWVSAPFEILAETRDSESGGWGLLLAWHDRDGRRHEEAFARVLFAGEGAELRARLADGGLSLGAGQAQRQALAEYFNIVSVTKRARSVARIGWHEIGGRPIFVLPGSTFGTIGERVVLQTESREPSLFNVAGTIADWRENIGELCVANSRLAFAASCAFAAPLLGVLGEDGGGFNLRGASRSGKSTALRVAASICGGTPSAGANGFIRQWRATGNGLEGVACAHSDSLLPLDEMGQVDGREAGEIAYMLSNGQAKARAARGGGSRPAQRWRTLFVSTGEVGLADKLAEAGRAGPKAGMEVRLADIPADAGHGLGLFEELHGFTSGDDFARHLQNQTGRLYGAPLQGFLPLLAERWRADPGGFPAALSERVSAIVRDWLTDAPEAGGQVRSVARRFALVAVAGEIASEAMLTGWPAGEATGAARICFSAWLAERGTVGAREEAQALAQLRAFIAQHGGSRFADWLDAPPARAADLDPDPGLPPPERFRTVNRAGWRRWEPGAGGVMAWRYYLTAEGLNEALAGLSPRESRRHLAERGFIVAPSGYDAARGNLSRSYTVPGQGKVRLYAIAPDILALDERSAN